MTQVYKRLRAKAFFSLLLAGLLCILIGCTAIYFTGGEKLIKYYTAKDNIFMSETGNFSEDTWYVCEDMNMLLDYYGTDKQGRYYIMPTVDGKYMGFYVYEENFATADAMSEAYWNAESVDELTTTLTGRGYIYRMKSDEQGYFEDWFRSAGADETIMNNLCYYTFVLTSPSKFLDVSDYLVMLIMLIIALFGVYYILKFLTGGYKKKVKKTLAANGISEESVEADMTYSRNFKHVDLGNKYMIIYGVSPELLILDRLVWTYVHIQKTKHMLYGVIPTGTTTAYSVYFLTNDGKMHTIAVKSEEAGQELVDAVGRTAPFVICGYHEDLDNLRNQNFRSLVQMVEEKKAELSGRMEAAPAVDSREEDAVNSEDEAAVNGESEDFM